MTKITKIKQPSFYIGDEVHHKVYVEFDGVCIDFYAPKESGPYKDTQVVVLGHDGKTHMDSLEMWDLASKK